MGSVVLYQELDAKLSPQPSPTLLMGEVQKLYESF